jgi:hypothetical protein
MVLFVVVAAAGVVAMLDSMAIVPNVRRVVVIIMALFRFILVQSRTHCINYFLFT